MHQNLHREYDYFSKVEKGSGKKGRKGKGVKKGLGKAPIKIGLEQWMKEPYVEGLADHNGHESCAGSRKGMREALDSERGRERGRGLRFMRFGIDSYID